MLMDTDLLEVSNSYGTAVTFLFSCSVIISDFDQVIFR